MPFDNNGDFHESEESKAQWKKDSTNFNISRQKDIEMRKTHVWTWIPDANAKEVETGEVKFNPYGDWIYVTKKMPGKYCWVKRED